MTIVFTCKNATTSLFKGVESVGTAGDPISVIQNNCLTEHNTRCRVALSDRVLLREYDESLPLTWAWNYSVYHASTPWVLICNDDVRFDPDWREKLVRALRKYPKALQVNMAYPVSSFSAFLIHKKLIGMLGWFDPQFPAFRWEDEDWYLRILEKFGKDLGQQQHAGKLPKNSIICWTDAVSNSHQQRRADAKYYGGLHWDLDPKRNEMAFWGKWRPDKNGYLTKGKVRGKKQIRVIRTRDTACFSEYGDVGSMELENYRDLQR